MKNTTHPSAYLQQKFTDLLRKHAPAAEKLGMLNPKQLTLAHQQQWFKLLVPAEYGGLELTLPQLVHLQEALSWADGSTGWVVTLCTGAGWFGGFIAPDTARQVFNTPDVCLAGSGAATGEAEMLEHGYRLNGTWKHASGAYHATHFTANCIIKKDGKTVLDDEGKPHILPFIIDKKDVALLPTWKYMGMVATGSHSFQVSNVYVPANRCFHIDAAYAEIDSPLYQYPFLQLAEATLAVNLSGMAIHFTDLCAGIFKDKQQQPRLTENDKARLMQMLAKADSRLQLARAALFEAVDASWQQADEANLKAVSSTSRQLALAVRETVDGLYPYCGLIAASPDTEINRVWRDFHTASQHALLTFER